MGIRTPGCFVLRGPLGSMGTELCMALGRGGTHQRAWGLQLLGLGNMAMSPALASFRAKVKPVDQA